MVNKPKIQSYEEAPHDKVFVSTIRRKIHYNLDGEPTTATKMKFSILPKHLGVVF